MDEVYQVLARQRIVPVIRTASEVSAQHIAETACEAGFRIIELTTTIPNVFGLVEALANRYPRVMVGIGTLQQEDHVRQAVDAGARLLITYKVSEVVARIGQQAQVPYILGAATPTEVDRCLELGSPIVKWFPAAVLGWEALRHMRGPLPMARFFPTGGITPESVPQWLEAGAVAVGIGGSLVGYQLGDEGSRTMLQVRLRSVMTQFGGVPG